MTTLTIPHQIVLTTSGWDLVLACTCTASWPGHGGRARYEPIETRPRFPAAEAIAAWRAWHEERGVEV